LRVAVRDFPIAKKLKTLHPYPDSLREAAAFFN